MSADREPPRKPRLTRAEARARTRELLLNAAARTFARKGFAGASVEEIAEEAGFTVGALYSNFASKEDLFLELMSGRARDRVSDTEEVLAGEYPAADDMWTALGQQMVNVADKDMDLAPLQAEFWLYAVRHPEVLERYAAMVRQRRAPLERLIGAGLDPRRFPEDLADRVAVVVSALFQGMVRQRRIDPERVSPELYGEALRWLFTGIEACEAQPRKAAGGAGRRKAAGGAGRPSAPEAPGEGPRP
jgi:AcrR family transcriptional regulator